MSFTFFFAIKAFDRLRIDQIFEIIGIDLTYHSKTKEGNHQADKPKN
jgi:hypothetical protein